MARFQRPRGEGVHYSAATLELFYDLVFVFAITQVSHYLLEHLTWAGLGQSAIMLLGTWWAWNYTTWVTNELDPMSPVVRAVILYCMLGSLLMSVAIPDAFGDRALLFAGSYVAIQVGRHAFLTFGSAAAGSVERARAGRILTYFCVAGVFYLLGAFAEDLRALFWVIGIAIELSGPLTGFWVPGVASVGLDAWDVETEHFTERFQLFLIIALGETIVITGATTYELELNGPRVLAFVVAFLGTAALWWLYFNKAASRAAHHLEHAENRTVVARDVYTYLHVVLIAAILLSAIADELVIAHPDEHLHFPEVAVACAGPALFLLGMSVFRLRMVGSLSPRRTVAGLLCLACMTFGTAVPAVVLALVLLAILVGTIVLEELSPPVRPLPAS